MFEFGEITDEQRIAITTINGPVLISAGPGTGKTYTLVQRIIYMIEEKKIDPLKIFVATFTNKAAKELLTRISNELLQRNIKNVNVNEMYIGTFHSLCHRIIKDNIEYSDLSKNLIMMDSFDQQYFVYTHKNKFEEIQDIDMVVGERNVWEKAKILCELFNGLTEEMIGPNKLQRLDGAIYKVISKAFKVYRDLLKENNRIDFSSIQSHCLGLFKKESQILEKYQNQFEYIMIDEYQDTNHIQEYLIFMLSKTKNICVVGDDDQALYRFRGATIRNILEFKSKFPTGQCTEVKLVDNFRSVPDIVNFYNKWMSETETDAFEPFVWDKYRINKEIKPKRNKQSRIPAVMKVSEKTKNEWQNKVLKTIKHLKNHISDYNQIAFLFNSVKSNEAKELANFLEKNGISVYSPRSNMFFERKEIRNIIGILLRIFPEYYSKLQLAKYSNWINKSVENYYLDCAEEINSWIKENPKLKDWLSIYKNKHKSLTTNTDYTFSSIFYELFQFPEFKQYIDVDLNSGVANQRTVRNMATFSNLLAKFEYNHQVSVFTPKRFSYIQEQFFNNFLRFLYMGGLEEYQDESEYAPKGCVSFLTIHQSKGMEFPIVFVGSLSNTPRKNVNVLLERIKNKIFDDEKSFEPEELIKNFDFWRQYYVAFSRAQDMLFLTCAEKKGKTGPTSQGRVPSIYFKHYYNALQEYNENINFSDFKFSLIKDSDLKETYAFTTDIAAYERCSIQYKMYRVLGFSQVRDASMMFGSLVHETIEDIHRAVLRNEISLITDEKINQWFDDNYKGLVIKHNSYLRKNILQVARSQVKKYVKLHQNNWGQIKDAEVDLSIIEPNFILKGQIDLLKMDSSNIEIMDFKAEQKPTPESLGEIVYEKKISQYKKQLQIYAYLVEEKYDVNVKQMRLYYTNEKKDPYITFEKDTSQINEMVKEFTNVVDNIQKKNFNHKTTNNTHCRECDMRYYCNRAK